MKIISIVGARPQFIKEAMMQKELKKHPFIKKKLIHTGQHYDYNMSGSFFEILKLEQPDYNLEINNSTHGKMTGLMMIKIEEILMLEQPDYVVLYGDTNSTLAGALVARKLNIRIVHIEAGLRQNPKSMPEEINRVLTDHSSDILFVSSQLGIDVLKNEGITQSVFNVGDIMYDLFLLMKDQFNYDYFSELGLEKNKYILCTIHRDFNVDKIEVLEPLIKSLNTISNQFPVVIPIHPRTADRLKKFNLSKFTDNLVIINPVDYFHLMGLVANSYKVITDSGGLQKEAYYSNKEAIVIMPDTGWIELVELGYNKLRDCNNFINDSLSEPMKIENKNIYGNGTASKLIVEIMIKDFEGR
ncbi:UDP-N-acetylglucosamine 2-epimerase [Tenericutes bacterium MZ-XQ]|nr:UDP-N-acetylglucosamine 2-epimerase [Tenericutes bacterium MZ-XQ]